VASDFTRRHGNVCSFSRHLAEQRRRQHTVRRNGRVPHSRGPSRKGDCHGHRLGRPLPRPRTAFMSGCSSVARLAAGLALPVVVTLVGWLMAIRGAGLLALSPNATRAECDRHKWRRDESRLSGRVRRRANRRLCRRRYRFTSSPMPKITYDSTPTGRRPRPRTGGRPESSATNGRRPTRPVERSRRRPSPRCRSPLRAPLELLDHLIGAHQNG
jgi:hypothetical protein